MILMVYGAGGLKEYLLPNIQNEDYTIILDRNLFQSAADIKLLLENRDGLWTIKESADYQLSIGHVITKSICLSGEMSLKVRPAAGEKLRLIVTDGNVVFPGFRKYHITYLKEIFIGKGEENYISYQFQEWISRQHAVLRRHGGDMYIENLGTNGVFFNNKRITENRLIRFGDVINIFGLHIVYLGDLLAVGSSYGAVNIQEDILKPWEEQSGTDNETTVIQVPLQRYYFNRSPRTLPYIRKKPVEIEAPPAPKESRQKPMLLVIGPAFTMALPMLLGCLMSVWAARISGRDMGVFMYTGMITAITSAVVGVTWAVLNLRHEKQAREHEEQKRFNAYGNYLIEIAEKLRVDYEKNQTALNSMYPSAAECCQYNHSHAALWNRNYSHEDFLFQRLGIGDIPFQIPIQIPKARFSIEADSLKQKPADIKAQYRTLRAVPVGVDLAQKQLIGLVGGAAKKGAVALMHSLIAQIAANNCYTDVKIALIYQSKGAEDQRDWECFKWLPHIWSQEQRTRYLASNSIEASDIFYELTNILRLRAEHKKPAGERLRVKPHYVVFIEDAAMLSGELLAKYIYEPQEAYGLTTFIMAETCEELPNACEEIIENDGYFQGIFNAMDNTRERCPIKFDYADGERLEQFTRVLSGIQVSEVEDSSDIPNSLEFFEMYQIKSPEQLKVAERWKKNRTYHSMRALIGKKAGGIDCYLDIHEKYHGPHGLVAGTTGSGKSELLQTYMLSLALNFSPDDVSFFVIDFKGGGMANLFGDLPHMIGAISNLSGNQVRRAMISIKSENMRRQRIFSEHGVNNINLYTRLYKNKEASIPIPHLFIIIDEFAELKKEEPDFMRELISVAQVGRSLGVHLILATQKPSGTVDDNIWSNAKFRLCLRVQDRQDSNDMLHKTDAAFITQAGRCYLQVGNDEVYELLQSGYSGGIYEENSDGTGDAAVTMLTLTGKEAIVGSKAKIKRIEAEKMQWYRILVEVIEQAAVKSGYQLPVWQISRTERSELIKFIYRILAERNIEYPESKSNTARLENFISLWPKEALTIDRTAAVIRSAAFLGGQKLPEKKEKTQLDVVVEYLKRASQEQGYQYQHRLWMPVLSEKIYLSELEGYSKLCFKEGKWPALGARFTCEALIGLTDDPVNQAQLPLAVNFLENGHLAVLGTVVSGKSTFLQTLLFSLVSRYSPECLNLYIFDYGSRMLAPFEKAPHSGGIVYESEGNKVPRFFHLIKRIMAERKALLQGGSFDQYVQVHGAVIPAILVAIDGYANFKEKTAAKYEEEIIKLAREGAGYGIYLVFTGSGFGLHDISNRTAEHFRSVICLEMGDKFKYMEALRTSRIEVLPEQDVKGRGLVSVGGGILEFQTALALAAADDFERAARIEQLCDSMDRAWGQNRVRPIPEIPENPTLQELGKTIRYQELCKDNRYLPIGYYEEDAELYSVNLDQTFCWLISGRKRTGKTNILKLLLHGAHCRQGTIAIFEHQKSELKIMAAEYGARYVATESDMFQYFNELMKEIKNRTLKKRRWEEEGLDEARIFEKMQQFPQIFIFIADLKDFLKMVYQPAEKVGAMHGFVENITEKGYLHNFYFFGCLDAEDYASLTGYRIFQNFIREKKGIHLGGNLSGQRIFSFSNVAYQELGKTLKKGTGYAANSEDASLADKIIIPLAGRPQ